MKITFKAILLISSCVLFFYTFAFSILGSKNALGEFSVEENSRNVPNSVLGFVDGKNADRVHLRADTSIDAESLGLYFTGTEVICMSEITSEWVKVVIGTQEGYMKSEYIHLYEWYGDAKQPYGIVKDGISCIVRSKPSENAQPLGFVFEGDTVTILGETNSHWYYVMMHEQTGYIHSDRLVCKMGDDAACTVDDPTLYYETYLSTFPFEQSGRVFWGIGTIDAGNLEKVHLRTSDSDLGQSLGEYYHGTKVVCVSDPSNLWTTVWIGNQIGRISSQYIRMDYDKTHNNCFVVGKIIENAVVYAAPDDEAGPTFGGDEKVINGQEVIIMGVTPNSFYFIDTGRGWGYISAEKVKICSSMPGDW